MVQINSVWGFVITGGGHAATPDNSTIFVPFDGSGARVLQGPFVAPDNTYYRYDDATSPFETYYPFGIWTAARRSRHTYSSLLAIEVRGQPALFTYGGALYIGSGSGTNATHVFDLSQTLAQAMARPDLGWGQKAPAPAGAVASSSGWDPVQKRVVVRGSRFIGAYYPDENRWEDWQIGAAPMGSDFQASVAMDLVGRKMYVLGDRLAEAIDLDTKAYTDLRGKPWAANFAIGDWQGGYPSGPGIAWHARTRQIVAWTGGQNLLLIDPVADVAKTVAMGGAAVTAAPSAGTYGRFRVIPGTDRVVLVNAVDQNVFIGTVPFDGGAPLPPSPPPPLPPSPPSPPPPTAAVTLVVTGDPAAGPYAVEAQVTPPGAWQVTFLVDSTLFHQESVSAYCLFGGDGPCATGTLGTGAHVITAQVFQQGGITILAESQITVTGGQSPPPGPSVILVPAGQPIPNRQWVERPNTVEGKAYMAGRGGKHGRAFYHAGLKAMVFAGGDWHTTQPQYEGYGDGVGSEIWSLDSFNDKWTLLRPFCVPGEPQPGRPDTVGWAYDSLRNRGLMSPGFYFITQGATSGCGAIEGWGGYAFNFTTKKFSGPDAVAGVPSPPTGWGGDAGASYATYNPTLDEYLRVFGTQLQRLSLATGTWRVQQLSNGNPYWNPVANRAQLVLDVQGQALYWLDVWSSPRALVKITLSDGHVTSIPLPAAYVTPYDQSEEVYLAFDPQSRTILIPNSEGMGNVSLAGLGIYHVDTGAWEWEPVPASVMGSVWGFDEASGTLIGIGKRVQPSAYFLYKYR